MWNIVFGPSNPAPCTRNDYLLRAKPHPRGRYHPESKNLTVYQSQRVDGPKRLRVNYGRLAKYCTFCVVPAPGGEEFAPLRRCHCRNSSPSSARRVKSTCSDKTSMFTGFIPRWHGRSAELITISPPLTAPDRIRYTTSHPVEFTDRLIDVLREVQNSLTTYIC